MANSPTVRRHYEALVKVGPVPTMEQVRAHIVSLQHPELLKKVDALAPLIFGDAGANTRIQGIAAKVAPFASAFGNLPSDIFVGVFPTGSFNAQVIKTTDGPLVLLNTGAEYLIFELTKLFVLSAVNLDASETLEPSGRILNELLSEERVFEQIARLLYSYLAQGGPEGALRMPLPTSSLLHVYAALASHTHEFLVSHEYAHIVRGHLDELPALNAVDSPSEAQFSLKSIEREIEADLVALHMMNAKVISEIGSRIDDAPKLFKLQLQAAAPIVFFGIAGMIESIMRDVNGVPRDELIGGHPPSDMRLKYSKDHFVSTAGEQALGIANVFEGWLDQYREPAIELATRLVVVQREA